MIRLMNSIPNQTAPWACSGAMDLDDEESVAVPPQLWTCPLHLRKGLLQGGVESPLHDLAWSSLPSQAALIKGTDPGLT